MNTHKIALHMRFLKIVKPILDECDGEKITDLAMVLAVQYASVVAGTAFEGLTSDNPEKRMEAYAFIDNTKEIVAENIKSALEFMERTTGKKMKPREMTHNEKVLQSILQEIGDV